MNDTQPEVSLVIPVYNEAPNIDELIGRCIATLALLGRTFEIVAVDDGSTDDSVELLAKHQRADNRIRIVRLVKNFGQTPALYAGLAHARGNHIVIIDADLQNPPEEIPKLLDKLREGYDVVQGWRVDRQDSLLRTVPSRLLNRFISRTIHARVRDLGCGLKAFQRDTVDRMGLFKHKARYLPAEMFWLGVNVAEVQVAHNRRHRGRSKYNFATLLRLLFDIVTGISLVPVRFVGIAGWIMTIAGFAVAVAVAAGWLFGRPAGPTGLISALVLFVAGVQMACISIVCQYVSRIYCEVQDRPYYIVKDVIE
jgi:undecaprenyl-phosphate 4-deoxy-4-formamido-L-arabinose transferase